MAGWISGDGKFDTEKFERDVDAKLKAINYQDAKHVVLATRVGRYMMAERHGGSETRSIDLGQVSKGELAKLARAYFILLSQRADVWGHLYCYPRCYFMDLIGHSESLPVPNAKSTSKIQDFDKILILDNALASDHMILVELLIPRLFSAEEGGYLRCYSTDPKTNYDTAEVIGKRALATLFAGDAPDISKFKKNVMKHYDVTEGIADLMSVAQIQSKQQSFLLQPEVEHGLALTRLVSSVYIGKIPHIVPFNPEEQRKRPPEPGVFTPTRLASVIAFSQGGNLGVASSITTKKSGSDNPYSDMNFKAGEEEDSDEEDGLDADSSDLEDLIQRGTVVDFEGWTSDVSVDE